MGTECTELFLIHSLLVWSASASCISVNSDIILSCVQVQRRFRGHTLGSLFHDHLSSTLFAFSGIFLVNYILLSSAVDESKTTMAINFQDARQLMNQVCVTVLCLSIKSSVQLAICSLFTFLLM
jgi:hypothetical protein